ncbi:unnamed protein product [Cylindrotheca closterium]|uniref:Uncharacterized protein n=1 Tax=Cylindrotheca closterium TaxID=2856 RepID=A0AAD2FS26_9STRA|nr:unnamed protein product [Cylindrotheca closterium]
MGEHVTKRASKKTKLYSKGRCASIADIKSTISNVAQLADFATENFSMSNNTPFLVEQFDTVMVALSRPDAVQWQHVIDLTGVAVHILHDLQTVFQVIASEAKDFTLHAEARYWAPFNVLNSSLAQEPRHSSCWTRLTKDYKIVAAPTIPGHPP